MTGVFLKDLGLTDYKEAWDYQEKLFQKVIENKTLNKDESRDDLNYLLFCEHPHVYTLGKSGSENNLLINLIQLQLKNASFYHINRGGDITYHGPGQIVCYPIFDLDLFGIGIKKYVECLEEVIIQTLSHFDISSGRLNGATGVWLDAGNKKARKIAAIGVRSSRFVTMHGFALNVNTDLSYFDNINPCGFTDKSVTSIAKEKGLDIDMEQVKAILLKKFVSIFNVVFDSKNSDSFQITNSQ
jgi:lipoyl(octanoyl) transferase